MTTLALFGTSADPPTAGHQQILRWLSYHYDHVVAWASDNPLKPDQTPLIHRAAMLQLLISDIDPHRNNIHCRQDLSHTRTIHTIEQVQQEWPQATLTFAIGSDLVDQLPQWYQAQTLLQRVKLVVVPRPGYGISPDALDRLQQMGATVAIANLQGLPVSSTASRDAIQRDDRASVDDSLVNDPMDRMGLTPPIRDYIMRERLYHSHRFYEHQANVRT